MGLGCACPSCNYQWKTAQPLTDIIIVLLLILFKNLADARCSTWMFDQRSCSLAKVIANILPSVSSPVVSLYHHPVSQHCFPVLYSVTAYSLTSVPASSDLLSVNVTLHRNLEHPTNINKPFKQSEYLQEIYLEHTDKSNIQNNVFCVMKNHELSFPFPIRTLQITVFNLFLEQLLASGSRKNLTTPRIIIFYLDGCFYFLSQFSQLPLEGALGYSFIFALGTGCYFSLSIASGDDSVSPESKPKKSRHYYGGTEPTYLVGCLSNRHTKCTH